MRNRTLTEIYNAQRKAESDVAAEAGHWFDLFVPWTPTMGTDEYPEQAFQTMQKGNFIDIPYITGLNKNEGILFVYGAFPDPIDEQQTIAV